MRDLVVIGAGPAGMAGALAAAEAGLDVLVIDEQARAGGQIFRRPPAAFGERHGKYAPYTWAAELIERFEAHPRIETRFRSTVYGVLRDRDEAGAGADGGGSMQLQVAVHTPGGGELVETQRILLATGAYDMSVAFPGWTKPGVMMAGAVQSLLKSQKVLAGRNLVLAGSHPLMLILAEQLLDAGANIAELAFARGLPGVGEMISAAPAAPGHLGVFVEAGKAVAKIAARGVKVTTRTIVTEAFGDSSVSGVGLVKVDAQWKPTGEVRRVESDLLVVGYGFTPSTELARQSGCAMQWDSKLGGWVVQHDGRFETTAAGIYVAGEPTGVSGAEQSWAEGRVAGLRIAESLSGVGSYFGTELRKAERKLRGAGRFSKVVQSMFEPNRHALAELSAHDGTLVCRCELVPTETIEGVLNANPFVSSANAVKLECRSGMGPCQGRYCEGTVTARVAKARGISFEEVGHFTAHLPVKPVPVKAYRQLGHAPE